MNNSKRRRSIRRWHWIWHGPAFCGVIEQTETGAWSVTCRGRVIGVVASEAVAEQLCRDCAAGDLKRTGGRGDGGR
jgi:hypothetical protein